MSVPIDRKQLVRPLRAGLRAMPLHDVAASVIAAVDLLRPLAEASSKSLVVVAPHTSCPAYFDEAAAQQVVGQLVSSATIPTRDCVEAAIRPGRDEYHVYLCGRSASVANKTIEAVSQPMLRRISRIIQRQGGCLWVDEGGANTGQVSTSTFSLPRPHQRSSLLGSLHTTPLADR